MSERPEDREKAFKNSLTKLFKREKEEHGNIVQKLRRNHLFNDFGVNSITNRWGYPEEDWQESEEEKEVLDQIHKTLDDSAFFPGVPKVYIANQKYDLEVAQLITIEASNGKYVTIRDLLYEKDVSIPEGSYFEGYRYIGSKKEGDKAPVLKAMIGS